MTPRICPPDHAHGRTFTCYNQHGCRCPDCSSRNAARRAERVRHPLVDVGEVREHLRNLRAVGATPAQIAAASHLQVRALYRIANEPNLRRVSAPTAFAILSLTPRDVLEQPLRGDRVRAAGAQRRLRALQALGWSLHELAAIAQRERHELVAVLGHKVRSIPSTLNQSIRDLHDEHWDRPPTPTSPAHARVIARRRERARRRGYLPAMAWDDLDTDPAPPVVSDRPIVDPIAIEFALAGYRTRLSPRERDIVRAIRTRRRSMLAS